MAFKLISETIEVLVNYYKEVFLIDTVKNIEDQSSKKA
jgi:hypothetical protein